MSDLLGREGPKVGWRDPSRRAMPKRASHERKLRRSSYKHTVTDGWSFEQPSVSWSIPQTTTNPENVLFVFLRKRRIILATMAHMHLRPTYPKMTCKMTNLSRHPRYDHILSQCCCKDGALRPRDISREGGRPTKEKDNQLITWISGKHAKTTDPHAEHNQTSSAAWPAKDNSNTKWQTTRPSL